MTCDEFWSASRRNPFELPPSERELLIDHCRDCSRCQQQLLEDMKRLANRLGGVPEEIITKARQLNDEQDRWRKEQGLSEEACSLWFVFAVENGATTLHGIGETEQEAIEHAKNYSSGPFVVLGFGGDRTMDDLARSVKNTKLWLVEQGFVGVEIEVQLGLIRDQLRRSVRGLQKKC